MPLFLTPKGRLILKAVRGSTKPGHKYKERKGTPGQYRYIYQGKEQRAAFGQVADIPTSLIERNPNQPRQVFDLQKLQELATSIDEQGLKNPIKLRPKGKKFEIVAGERRFRAHKMLEKPTIRAIVENLSDREMAEEALLENISREDLTPVEEGKAYSVMLRSDKWDVNQLAKITGRSTSYIRQMQVLSDLIPEAQKLVEMKQLNVSMAIKIAGLGNVDLQRTALQRAVKGDLTTNDFSIYVVNLKASQDVLPLFGGELEEINKLPEGVTKRKMKGITKTYNEIFNRVAGLVRRTIGSQDYKLYPKVLQGDLGRRIDQLDVLERQIRKIKNDLISERSRRQIIARAGASQRMKQLQMAKSVNESQELQAIDALDQRVKGLKEVLKILRGAGKKKLTKSLTLTTERLHILGGRLYKATIRTPVTAGGKVDYGKVPVGASIWITISDESSPLHGRHIKITKRPDGQFAWTGGAGHKFVHGEGGEEAKRVKETKARRHLTMQAGELKRQAKDIRQEKEYAEAKEKRTPLEEEAKKIHKEAQAQMKQTREAFLESVSIQKKQLSKEEIEGIKQTAREQAQRAGMEEKQADQYAQAVARAVNKRDKEHRERIALERQKAHRLIVEQVKAGRGKELQLEETRKEGKPEIEVALPEVPTKANTAEEIEHAVERHFEETLAAKGEGKEIVAPPEHPTVMLGSDIKEIEAPTIRDEAKSKEAVEAFERFMQARKAESAIRKEMPKLPKLEITTPAAIEQLRVKLAQPVSKEELNKLAIEYEQAHHATDDDAFYNALSEHWNDKVGYTLNGHVNEGAASAITGLVGKYLGERFEVGRLTGAMSPEAAAMTVAFKLRSELSEFDFDKLIEKVEDFNAVNQERAEKKAMEKHKRLLEEVQKVTDQEKRGEIQPEMASILRTENLLLQRENLGKALGSLTSSAALLEGLTMAKKAKDNKIVLNVGRDRQAATERIEKLGLRIGKNAQIMPHPQLGWQIHTTARALGKYATYMNKERQRNAEWDKLKTNPSDPGSYLPPSFKKTFFNDATGKEEPLKMRIEQRNDIEWLKKAGSGVITRVTGAGKTNTALGFLGHQIAQNPDYKGIVAVPRGRVQQWIDEAHKFTTLNVVAIPEGTNQEARIQLYAQNNRGGAIFVTSHRDASFDVAAIEAVNPKVMVLDEPQELKSRTSARRSAAFKRLTKIPANNRLALTATPAKEAPVEAYNLVNWTNPGALGFRTRFERAFSGFGAGTNAQDQALQKMLFNEIAPYISGERLTPPDFKVNHSDRKVQRTVTQVTRQKEIERDATSYINQKIREVAADKRVGPWRKKAKERAMNELKQMHKDNLHGGSDNAKVKSFISEVKKGNRKHVVFVDTKSQRRAVVDGLTSAGYKQNQIKNITGIAAAREVEKRKEAWKRGGQDVPFIIIDKTSAAGHNLQEGSVLHVIGSPQDAAEYLQAQGRVARSPRKGDVDIVTYRYSDSPFEDLHWNKLDAQLKILGAVSPGLFKGALVIRNGRLLLRKAA